MGCLLESTLNSRFPSNQQMLEFRIFNIAQGTQPMKGRLPISPGSHLTWIGYSEEGQLSSYDSKVSYSLSSAHITRLNITS